MLWCEFGDIVALIVVFVGDGGTGLVATEIPCCCVGEVFFFLGKREGKEFARDGVLAADLGVG